MPKKIETKKPKTAADKKGAEKGTDKKVRNKEGRQVYLLTTTTKKVIACERKAKPAQKRGGRLISHYDKTVAKAPS
jgi:hypothetical protein